MKLLFVTQTLDTRDAVLGFVPRWVEGLAYACESVRVIALEVGDTSGIPANVDWRVLGRHGRVGRYLRYQKLLKEAFRDGYGTLLTHMVPRYSVYAARQARRFSAGHFMWYTHKGVDRSLRKAVELVDRVFTAGEDSMRVETNKKVVTGHGIDVAHFDHAGRKPVTPRRLLSVGRLTPSKDSLTQIDALARVVARGYDVYLDWAGAGLVSSDKAYDRKVRAAIEAAGLSERVKLLGPIPYREVGRLYWDASIFVSTSLTGSIDKVVLEAMAAGRPVLTCNESFPPIFAELGPEATKLLTFPPGDADALARRIMWLLDQTDEIRQSLGDRLTAIVSQQHEVDRLMRRLVAVMEKLK